MAIAQSPQFKSFEAYLAADPSDLPEGRYEYCDGELVPVMTESGVNDAIANYLFLVLANIGIPFQLIRPHYCEVEVPGRPRTRLPDLTLLDEVHIPLIARRNTITRGMRHRPCSWKWSAPATKTQITISATIKIKRSNTRRSGCPNTGLLIPIDR